MAVMWAFPFSLIAALLTILIWIEFLWEIVGLIWILALLIFMLFPFYVNWLKPRKKGLSFSKYTVVFDLARNQFILWGIIVSGIVVIYLVTQSFTFGNLIHWAFLSFVIILFLSLDLFGSTPVVKSGLHEDRFFEVKLNESECKGTGFCEDVCPKNCFDVDRVLHKTTISRPDDCAQCGA
jgi:NAD-dependent dihydropyrimidine dehydrogenase PreA subunit